MHPVIVVSDGLLFFLLFLLIFFVIRWGRNRRLRKSWKKVIYNPFGLCATIILGIYFSIALLDSIHFEKALPPTQSGVIFYTTNVTSLLDELIAPIGQISEKTYSKPLAMRLYTKESVQLANGKWVRDYPLLNIIQDKNMTKMQWHVDILSKLLWAFLLTMSVLLISGVGVFILFHRRHRIKFPWFSLFATLGTLLFFGSAIFLLAQGYHVFGTDKVGQDVLYQSIKSIRTGILIGTLTTLVTLPFAIFFGMLAGYFGGWLDDVVQYLYTTLSSIPGVLLIAASVLSIQIYISNHPDYFTSINARADIRLLALCFILGVTSWTSLCRLLRAETLKLRELDYVLAATLLGSTSWKIIKNHILPNITHIILITVVLDFSGLVLAEAVLTYVGVGVDPTTFSWGNMIDSARLELAREPVVWWPLTSAFVLMFVFILAANLFADSVQDAFNPRSGT